jgi:hypothetical protein
MLLDEGREVGGTKVVRKSIVAALLQRQKYGNILLACMFNVELVLEECSLESDNCQRQVVSEQ